MAKINIYPIYLDTFSAERLVKQHLNSLFHDKKSFFTGRTYDFSAAVYENGEVNVVVTYSFDDGYCAGGGTCLNEKIKPFSQTELDNIVETRIFNLAEKAVKDRERQIYLQKVEKEVEKIKKRM